MNFLSESIKEEKIKKKHEIEEVEEKPSKRIIIPEICAYSNDEGTDYIAEIILPGVEKETIKLKINNDNFFVVGETESTKYTGAYGLCCPVDSEKAKATYKNGLLKVEVPYKDVTLNTVDVKIE